MFFASHVSHARVPYSRYMMTAHRVLGPSPGHTFHVQKCLRRSESPGDFRGFSSSSATSFAIMFRERTPISMLINNIPRCSCSSYVTRLHDRSIHHGGVMPLVRGEDMWALACYNFIVDGVEVTSSAFERS
jgi:hypothetical protein